MSSTFGGLNTMVRGLSAQQLSLDTTGHNVSNASTAGYSRQSAALTTTAPETVYAGGNPVQLGTGVYAQSITRARDTFIDQQMWRESSTLGYGQTAQTTMDKIEGIFNDQSDTGVQSALNNFWNAWQTLSTNSSNDSARTAVRERGADLVDAVGHAADQLKNLVADTNTTVSQRVDQINETASEIFGLNRQISNIESGSTSTANDLRDKRDLLVDQLSKVANVRAFEDNSHNYIIQISDVTLVGANNVTKLAVASNPDPQYGNMINGVVVAGSNPPQTVKFTDGEMKALVETNSVTAKSYLDKLSTISQFLLQNFNADHRAGYGSDNSTGTNFFGDAGSPDYSTNAGVAAALGRAVPPPPTTGEWLSELQVNPDLYAANGASKIAAKTVGLATLSPTQSNSAGGAATVTGIYTPPVGSATYKNFQVAVTAGGISYTVTDENGNNLAGPTAVAGPGPFALAYGLSISLAASANTAVGDTYSFSVPQGNSSGDNAQNLSNDLKTTTSALLGGASLDGYYQSLVADLGIQSQNKQNLTDNQQTLVDQITNWRESTSGVNLDEEMSNMLRFQKGYSAAARVITTIDDMLDKLINDTGLVGR